jgi:hypothetical protein
MGSKVYDHGQVTTPQVRSVHTPYEVMFSDELLQLHWIVRAFNQNPSAFVALAETNRNDLQQYNKNLVEALSHLLDGYYWHFSCAQLQYFANESLGLCRI